MTHTDIVNSLIIVGLSDRKKGERRLGRLQCPVMYFVHM